MTRFKFCSIMVIVICSCTAFLAVFHYTYSSSISGRFCNNVLEQSSRGPKSYAQTLLDMTRSMIELEMWDYNYTSSGVSRLEELQMESGGTPVRTVIVSTWRSGSSFLGDLLNSMPGSFYSYEPLKMFDTYKQIRGPPYAARAISLLKNIMKCNHTDSISEEYFSWNKEHLSTVNTFWHVNRFWDKCRHQNLCFDAEFLSKFYKLFPIQTIKLDRFRLSLVKDLLDDDELNVKVVLLVRDPRAVVHSRRNIDNFCSVEKEPDCQDPGVLCGDMVSDHAAAASIQRSHPGSLTVLRFEELAFNLNATTLQLLNFLRLEPTPSIFEFLRTHTNDKSKPATYSTYRISKDIPYKWIKGLEFDTVKEIQDLCKEAMSLWGYEPAHSSSHLTSADFIPLSPYTL